MTTQREPDWMLPKLEDQPKDAAGRAAMVDRWMKGMERHAGEVRGAAIEAFAAHGWPFKWFTEWKPTNAADKKMSDALDEAIEVASRYYPKILERGLDRPEDMGILQHKGWGGSEGIQAKRPPYASNTLLLSIYAVTGPSNLDPTDQKVHFEPGAKSHVFHLVYKKLPSLDVLQGDLAAYPLITAEDNRASNAPWHSEGWISQRRIYEHKPWNTIAPLGVQATPAVAAAPKAIAIEKSGLFQLPKIAPSQAAFIEALFNPGGTYDGYIQSVQKTGRNAGVRFNFRSHDLCANGHGVICFVAKTPDDKPLYRYTNKSEWPFNLRETEKIFETQFRPLLSGAAVSTPKAEIEQPAEQSSRPVRMAI